MDVIIGTYDEVILGYRLVEIGDDLQIEASFTDNSHAGSVRCVSISKNGILASGSADETIRLFNLRKQKELGSLMHHDGSVTSLDFHKNFMFSTSEDGKLCVWKTFTWECLRTLKGQKSAVNCVSVHPTGKLALTVGKDRSLRTWNLITGRSAFITNLHQVADIVRWSPDGDKYIIVVQNKMDIYSVETAEVILTIQTEGRINCVEFLNNDVCCYGGEGGTVTFYNISETKEIHVCDTGTNRIKGLCITCCQLRGEDKRVMTIASSEGSVKLYTLTEDKDKIDTDFLVGHDSGFRVTCLAVFSAKESKPNEKTKKEKAVKQTVDSQAENDEKSNSVAIAEEEESSNVNKSVTFDDNESDDDKESDDDYDSSDGESEMVQTVKPDPVKAKNTSLSKGKKNRKRQSGDGDMSQENAKKMKNTSEDKLNKKSNLKNKSLSSPENVSDKPGLTNSQKKNRRNRKRGKKE